MFGWMDEILCLTDYLETDDFEIIINALDTEFMQLMLHSENEVSKFMMGHIEWSPRIGIWLSRRWLLKRVQQWMQGTSTPDPRNMFRDCHRINIPDPREVSYDTICVQIVMSNTKISCLAKDAPALRRQHLQDLIEHAEEKLDTVRAQAILEILCREGQKKKWRRSITPPVLRAAPPLLVSRLKPLPARQHTEPRTRYLTIWHITFCFGSAMHSPRRYILLLFYKNLDLLEIQIVLKKYWTGRSLIPQIPTSGRPSFSRRLTTRMLCWGTRQSIPQFLLPTSKGSGNALTRINRLHSVEDTTLWPLQGGEL
jgi:hypothetical protein